MDIWLIHLKVDSGDSTQDSIARAVSSVFGIKHGFHGKTVSALLSAFAKSDLSEAIQDVNEEHMEGESPTRAFKKRFSLTSPF